MNGILFAVCTILAAFPSSLSANSISPATGSPANDATSAAIARDVFVVVDVSGSVTQAGKTTERAAVQKMVEDGKRLVIDLVRGSFRAEDFPDWKWGEQLLVSPLLEIVTANDARQPMSGLGKRAVIVPFADKAITHPAATSAPFLSFPSDFETFVGKEYPTSYRDQNTYVTLARARTAELAESLQIRQYYFLMVTDAVQDPKAAYSEDETKLLNRWDSENFVAAKTRIGLFEYAAEGLDSRNFQVDVWKVDLDLAPASARITTIAPASGATISPGIIDVQWEVATGESGTRSRPSGYSYYLSLLDANSGSLLQSISVENAHSVSMPIESLGNYRLTISGNRQSGGGDTAMPPVLGQAEVLFSITDDIPPTEGPGGNISLGFLFPSLFAEEATKLRWRMEGKDNATSPPIPGEFKVTLFDDIQKKELTTQSTREQEVTVTFPKSGDYLFRLQFRPDEKYPPITFDDQLIHVGEHKAQKEATPKAVDNKGTALQFLLPRTNSKVKPGKIIFRWSAPAVKTPITQYRLRVTGPEKVDQTAPTSGFAKTFKKPGRYTAQLTVVAPPDLAESIEPAQLVFTIESRGGGIWLLLLVMIGGAVGYYFWKNSRNLARTKKTPELRP